MINDDDDDDDDDNNNNNNKPYMYNCTIILYAPFIH